MEFPTLHKLCIQSLATHIRNGMQIEDVFDDDEKYNLLYGITLDNGEQTRTVVRELFRTCKFRTIAINKDILQVIIANFEIDSLEQLTVYSIKQDTLEQIKNQLMEKYGIPIILFDILHLFELFIEPSSRGKLRLLSICGCDIESTRNIIDGMAQFFPNIRNLILNENKLTNHGFNAVCQSFPNLTNLSVPSNAFDDLQGISNLERLEILDISDCHIDNGFKMRELFTLKNLRVLDISSRRAGFSPNFTSYISCNQALPQLEFIDISFNAVTEDQLKKLVQTHLRLSTVSLIGTPLQAHPQSEDHNVEFLTVANLESCIRSIKRYILATDKKIAIFDQIYHILMLQNENHTEDVLKDCLQEVLNFRRLDTWDAWLHSTRCLLELCRGSRIDIFTSDEVQKILVVFLHFCTFTWKVEELSDDYFALHSNIWRMFSECDAFRKHPGSVEKLCRSAAKMTRNCLCLNEESRRLWFYCVQVIHSCCFVEQDSRAYQHIIDNEDLAKDFLIKATYRVNFNDDTIKVFEVANVFIVHYATVNHHFDSNLTFYLIEVLWGSLYYEGNEFHQTLIHNFIHNIINSNRLDVWLYFQEPLFSKLTNWMTLHGHNVQKLTIMVFCWIKHYCECLSHNVNPENFSQMEWRATAIINTIHWYQPIENHRLGLYEYLALHGRGEVALWAKWILYCVREAEQAVEQMVES
ncbi:unnamed protein product [Caenorhabditis brenneri]